MKTTPTIVLSTMLAAALAGAQDPVAGAPAKAAASVPSEAAQKLHYSATRKSTGFVLEAGEHELADLIDQVAEFMGYNILVNQAELGGLAPQPVRITKRIEVDVKGCWELFGSLLYHKGFAIVALDPDKGFYEVVAMNGPRRAEINIGARFVKPENIADYANLKASPVLTSVPLRHINATVATNALRPFFAAGGSSSSSVTLGNVGNNTAILLQGFGPQVFAAYQLLRLVDVPQDKAESGIGMIRLEHASAQELVIHIDQFLSGRSQMNYPQGAAPVPPLLKIVAIPSLNAVVVSGDPERMQQAKALIAQLDVPAAEKRPVSTDLEAKIKQLEARLKRLEKAMGGGAK